jgi:hypothetical protein
MIILSLRTLLVILPLSVAAQETPVANAKKANPNSTQGTGDSQSLATGLIMGVPAVGLVTAAGVIGARKLYHDKRQRDQVEVLKEKVLPETVETEDDVLGGENRGTENHDTVKRREPSASSESARIPPNTPAKPAERVLPDLFDAEDHDAVEIQDAHSPSELPQTPPNTPVKSPEAKAAEFEKMWQQPLREYGGGGADGADNYTTRETKYLEVLSNEIREKASFGKQIPTNIEHHYRHALQIVHNPAIIAYNKAINFDDHFGYTLEQTQQLREHLNQLKAHPKLYQDVLQRLDAKIPNVETIKQVQQARLKFGIALGHPLRSQKIVITPPHPERKHATISTPKRKPSVSEFRGEL